MVCPCNDFFLLEQRNSNIHSARLRQPTTKEHKDRVNGDEWKKTKETGVGVGGTCRPLRNRDKNFPLSTFKSMQAAHRCRNLFRGKNRYKSDREKRIVIKNTS